MATASLTAGHSSAAIIPTLPCALAGYGVYLGREAGGVLDELEVHCLVVKDGEGSGCAVVTFDLIGFSVQHADQLRRSVAQVVGLGPESVLLSFSHTHSSPPTLFLRGMGEVDPAYLERVDDTALRVARNAAGGMRACELWWNVEQIEPIGFNRVTGGLEPMDTHLGLVDLRGDPHLSLANHSCHPVTLGRNTQISADYVGRFRRSAARSGRRLLFLQGFCGNIDPFRNKVRWGQGTEADIDFYGEHLASRLEVVATHARRADSPRIVTAEERVAIPQERLAEGGVEQTAEGLRAAFRGIEQDKVERFITHWRREALRASRSSGPDPALQGVPVQAIAIGPAVVLGLPGEVSCEIGLGLRRDCPALLPVGYGNGDIGYLPTAAEYEKPGAYAPFVAPRFYGALAFRPEVESTVLSAARRALARVKPPSS